MTIRDLIPWRKRRGRGEGDESVPAEQDMRDVFRDAMEDFFGDMGQFPRFAGESSLAPAIDVSETDNAYKVSVELPGTSKDDIEVTVEQGRLNIRGEKKEESREEDEDYLRVERSYGKFSRSIPLPSTVDEEDIEASFEDGVLQCHLPKTGEARGQRIEIEGGSE